MSDALARRARRAKGVKPLGPSEGYLLTGLVRCHGCGYAMDHAPVSGRRYYRCRPEQHGDGPCSEQASVPAEDLEEWVAAEFEARFLSGSFDPDGNDEAVEAAQADVERWKERVRGSMRRWPTWGRG